MFSLAQAHEAFAPNGEIADAQLRARFRRSVKEFLNVATDRVEWHLAREG